MFTIVFGLKQLAILSAFQLPFLGSKNQIQVDRNPYAALPRA